MRWMKFVVLFAIGVISPALAVAQSTPPASEIPRLRQLYDVLMVTPQNDVGVVISHSRHHLHSYYVIRNSELAGLTDNEIEMIALASDEEPARS